MSHYKIDFGLHVSGFRNGPPPKGAWTMRGLIDDKAGLICGEGNRVLFFIPESRIDAWLLVIRNSRDPATAKKAEMIETARKGIPGLRERFREGRLTPLDSEWRPL